jgi:hypothetical protein
MLLKWTEAVKLLGMQNNCAWLFASGGDVKFLDLMICYINFVDIIEFFYKNVIKSGSSFHALKSALVIDWLSKHWWLNGLLCFLIGIGLVVCFEVIFPFSTLKLDILLPCSYGSYVIGH